ncbi:MAG: hypothetical protein VKI81_11400 [Synechococcaceae cyanobacterium]|nr:hypothetical protein [Synechococcaceae cyanobacterium]
MSEQQRKDKPEPYSMADLANKAAETLQIGTSRAEILSAAAQAAEPSILDQALRAAELGPGMIESLRASTLGLSDPWLRELTEQRAEIERLLGLSSAERTLKDIQADFASLSASSQLIAELGASVMLPQQALIESLRAEPWPGYEVIFPRPKRRPESKPPAEPVQITHPERQELELLEQVAEALRTGEIKPAAMAKTLATVLQAPRGPKQADSEFTEARVVSMWLDWQAHSRDLTAEAFAQRRWMISKGYMYKLFRDFGLMPPVRKRSRKTGH